MPADPTQAANPPRPAQAPMAVLAQYVKDLSFENPNAPQSLLSSQGVPQVAVSVDVETRQLDAATWEVVLHVRAEAKSTDKVAFLAEIAYAGLIALQNVPAEHVRPLLLIEGPRLLFPFVRAMLADLTRDGGFPPVLINPIDFADLYRQRFAAQPQGDGKQQAQA